MALPQKVLNRKVKKAGKLKAKKIKISDETVLETPRGKLLKYFEPPTRVLNCHPGHLQVICLLS